MQIPYYIRICCVEINHLNELNCALQNLECLTQNRVKYSMNHSRRTIFLFIYELYVNICQDFHNSKQINCKIKAPLHQNH